MSGFEFGRKAGESDEDWAAACRGLARALAKATGTEHLLPNALAAGARSDETNAKIGSVPKGRQSGLKGNAHD